jgi:ElaB/YqjD/DUF883 family membrane-anchored ribosome-binding protein
MFVKSMETPNKKLGAIMPTRNGHHGSTKSRGRSKQASAGDQLRSAADAVVSSTEKGVEMVQESAEAYIAQGREVIADAGGRVLDFVRNRPLQALALAAGAGALFALIARRR